MSGPLREALEKLLTICCDNGLESTWTDDARAALASDSVEVGRETLRKVNACLEGFAWCPGPNAEEDDGEVCVECICLRALLDAGKGEAACP